MFSQKVQERSLAAKAAKAANKAKELRRWASDEGPSSENKCLRSRDEDHRRNHQASRDEESLGEPRSRVVRGGGGARPGKKHLYITTSPSKLDVVDDLPDRKISHLPPHGALQQTAARRSEEDPASLSQQSAKSCSSLPLRVVQRTSTPSDQDPRSRKGDASCEGHLAASGGGGVLGQRRSLFLEGSGPRSSALLPEGGGADTGGLGEKKPRNLSGSWSVGGSTSGGASRSGTPARQGGGVAAAGGTTSRWREYGVPPSSARGASCSGGSCFSAATADEGDTTYPRRSTTSSYIRSTTPAMAGVGAYSGLSSVRSSSEVTLGGNDGGRPSWSTTGAYNHAVARLRVDWEQQRAGWDEQQRRF